MLSNEEIGARIKSERTAKEMTLQDVARKIGVASSTIQRYEAGLITNIKLPVIESIANVLDVNPSWLIGKSAVKSQNIQDYNDIKKTHETIMVDKIEKKIVENYRLADPYDKTTVLRALHINEGEFSVVSSVKTTAKKYEPTEDDLKSLVARNGKKLTRAEAFDIIATLFSDDEEDEE